MRLKSAPWRGRIRVQPQRVGRAYVSSKGWHYGLGHLCASCALWWPHRAGDVWAAIAASGPCVAGRNGTAGKRGSYPEGIYARWERVYQSKAAERRALDQAWFLSWGKEKRYYFAHKASWSRPRNGI